MRTTVDRALALRIRAAVESSPMKVQGLSVYVHDGSVDVYGTIENDAKRENVLSLVTEQPGAKRITDHMVLSGA